MDIGDVQAIVEYMVGPIVKDYTRGQLNHVLNEEMMKLPYFRSVSALEEFATNIVNGVEQRISVRLATPINELCCYFFLCFFKTVNQHLEEVG